jgi:hypothetical protein
LSRLTSSALVSNPADCTVTDTVPSSSSSLRPDQCGTAAWSAPCVVSWVAGVVAWPPSCVVRPLDKPCDDDEPAPPDGSGLCVAAGAVLCVVGVVCTPDPAPFDAPGAVVWVVGVLCGVAVACTVDGASLDVPGAVPCGVGVEGCDGWDVVPIE